MSGRDSGGDILDMAAKGTSVPEDAAAPRHIKSVPRPGQAADDADSTDLGAANLAEAATNATDIPRTTKDTAGSEIISGTGDALPAQVDSKRLHDVPGGVTHDPNAKGSTRYTDHIVQQSHIVTGASEGPRVDKAPGEENLTQDQARDQLERKV